MFKIQFLREFRDGTLLGSSISITFNDFFYDLGLSCRHFHFPCFRVFFDLLNSVQQTKTLVFTIMVAARAV